METLARWEAEKSTWPNQACSRFVRAAGIRWHVQQTGRGPELLLIHGMGASTHSWRDLLPLLANDFSLTAVDLPGHGFTEATAAERSTISGMSDSLAVLLQTLGITPGVVVGHSAGAVIACRMALDGRIAPHSIVSINGAFIAPGGAVGAFFPSIARIMAGTSYVPRLLARRVGTPQAVARLLAGTGSRIDAAGVDLYARLVRNPHHVAGALTMMSQWDLHSFYPQLARLETPLALLVGENDLTVHPRQAQLVRRQVARARLFSLPGLGHLAHEEQPGLIAHYICAIAGVSVDETIASAR